ncbi:MAG: HAD hydrolase-like protein [Candidatus Roizmanbacteria bacterium]|nr:HAD hydrolase-like protein [Candidatus Roizmanbacteria bacterium]
MKNIIILFDIDYTIFNTHQYKKNTITYICSRFHVASEDMKLFDTEYRSKNLNPAGVNMKDYTEKMAVKFSLSSKDLYQLLIDTEEIFMDTLYPDSLPTLSHLSKQYTLGIFSQGHLPFQKNKLIKTNILHLFEEQHTYIHLDKTHIDHMQGLPKNALVVDDKVTVIDHVSKHIPAIHIDRDHKIEKSNFPIIHSLSELPEAINRLMETAI